MARVALFVPCYQSLLRPSEVAHAQRVLEALGDDVSVVEGPCCGQPAFNSGFREEAQTAGRAFLRAVRPFETVVIPSGSCTSMVRHYLPELFEGTRGEGAARIAGRCMEASAYIAAHLGLPKLALAMDATVAYHDSCHNRRELGQTQTALGLLERVAGLEVRRLRYEEECCGFGGTFTVKLQEIASAMGAAKVGDVAGTGARVLVSTDLSCLAHIEATAQGTGVPIETWTVTELLSRALP